MMESGKGTATASRRALASLISKSEKAQQKLAGESWQHTMLRKNVEALHLASALMAQEAGERHSFTVQQLEEALAALASMIDKAEEAQAKFSPGTSHHSLQRNRLEALRLADARTRAALDAQKV